MSEAFEKLFSSYKQLPPDIKLISPFYEEHIIYWLLIKMAQIGKPELLNTMSRQLGVDAMALRMEINAHKGANSSFPLFLGRQLRTRLEIIQIDPNIVIDLRDAAVKISPEHMPPYTVTRKKNDKVDKIGTEYFFHLFSETSSSEMVTREVMSVLEATEGLDNADAITSDELHLINLITPQLQIIILPIQGKESEGYYTDKRNILDLRDQANRLASAAYDINKILPIIVSLGFTTRARISCLDTPKVLLIDLWAFLKLIGRLQVTGKRAASQRAFTYMHSLMRAPSSTGSGHFYPDGFVNQTFSELLDRRYPLST